MSRIVKYILVGTMLMVIFMTTACSVKNKNNTAGVHISILAKNSQYTDVDYESTEVIRKVSENSGYDIEWKLRQPDSYYDVVRELILNGDTLADIIQLPDIDMNMEYINTGKFVCLDEYLDYMPNYKKFLQSTCPFLIFLKIIINLFSQYTASDKFLRIFHNADNDSD